MATSTKTIKSGQEKATPAKPKRRSPISREEGQNRLIQAGLSLISERPFSEVGVREIATKADVNHGFVHTWFGGKSQLFVAMARELADQVAAEAATAPAGEVAIGPFNPKTQLLIRLLTWLTLEGNTFEGGALGGATRTALVERFVAQDGMDPDVAESASVMAIALAFSMVNFGNAFGTGPQEVAKMLALWRHIVGLLAKYPPAIA